MAIFARRRNETIGFLVEQEFKYNFTRPIDFNPPLYNIENYARAIYRGVLLPTKANVEYSIICISKWL